MTTNTYSPHESTLGIVNTLRQSEIDAYRAVREGDVETAVQSTRQRDKLTAGLRSALNAGIPMSDLVASTGLAPEQIRQRVARPLDTE